MNSSNESVKKAHKSYNELIKKTFKNRTINEFIKKIHRAFNESVKKIHKSYNEFIKRTIIMR